MNQKHHYLIEVAFDGRGAADANLGSGTRYERSGCSVVYWGERARVAEEATWIGFVDGSVAATLGPKLLDDLRSGRNTPPVGLYNLVGIEPIARRVTIASDAFGTYPCFFHVGPDRVLVSSSLVWLAEAAKLAPDIQGVAERYALCWTIGSRTEATGASWLLPGSLVTFEWSAGEIRQHTQRTSPAWRHHDDRPASAIVRDFSRVWRDAVARAVPTTADATVGLLLSGGLDSRLILAEMSRQGTVPICCTHGDLESEEAALARRCATLVGAPLLTNALDASVSFEDLGLDRAFERTGGMFNLIWGRSADVLAAHGVTHVASGCGGDSLLGGSYYAYGDQKTRLAINMARALGVRALPDAPLDEANANGIADMIAEDARKRLRYHSVLLRPELRDAALERLPAMRVAVLDVLDRYRREGDITWQQALERFKCEHRVRKYLSGQELQLGARLTLIAPFFDRDALALTSNTSPRTKSDHAVYYAVFRREYPRLAQVPVSNLDGPVSRPAIAIEAWRLVVRLRDRFEGRPEHRSWINFEAWMRDGKLPAYEAEFLACETAFDPAQVRIYFDELRAGKRLVYDGNETLNFLAVGKLLEHVGQN